MLTVTRSINDTLLIREPCSIRIVAVDGIYITFEIQPNLTASTPVIQLRSGLRELPLPASKSFSILPDGTQVLDGEPVLAPVVPTYPIDLDTAEKRHARQVGNSTDGPGAGSPAGRGPGH